MPIEKIRQVSLHAAAPIGRGFLKHPDGGTLLRGNSGYHFSEGRAALGGGLEVERSNRAPCFALDLDESSSRSIAASPASTRARNRLGRRGQFGGLAHLDQLHPLHRVLHHFTTWVVNQNHLYINRLAGKIPKNTTFASSIP